MIFNDNSAQKTAELLLQINAIKLNPKNPFTWASGWKSPIYCDNRITLSYPEIRTFIRQQFVSIINEHFAEVDVIAGVATGGIAQGVLVAQDIGKPFIYVRPEEKKHGLTNKIEGVVKEGQTVLIIEDLISTGKSSLQVVDSLREVGCVVKGMVAIFTYGLDVSLNAFNEKNVPLFTITDYDTLIDTAKEETYIKDEDISSLNNWKMNPEKWSEERMNK